MPLKRTTTPSAKSPRHTPPRRPTLKKTCAPERSGDATGQTALAREITLLRKSVDKLAGQSVLAGTTDEINALRRVLADIIESRTLAILQKLAAIRHAIPLETPDLASRIDALLEELGAVSFSAERLEHLDPVIHEVGREVKDSLLPDGVIAATLRPGWRSARGGILARAVVSLSRRS